VLNLASLISCKNINGIANILQNKIQMVVRITLHFNKTKLASVLLLALFVLNLDLPRSSQYHFSH